MVYHAAAGDAGDSVLSGDQAGKEAALLQSAFCPACTVRLSVWQDSVLYAVALSGESASCLWNTCGRHGLGKRHFACQLSCGGRIAEHLLTVGDSLFPDGQCTLRRFCKPFFLYGIDAGGNGDAGRFRTVVAVSGGNSRAVDVSGTGDSAKWPDGAGGQSALGSGSGASGDRA